MQASPIKPRFFRFGYYFAPKRQMILRTGDTNR
ncbi:hypothetical protein SAMN05421770_101897 [Granulicella rosea]|uniref:Uncharacterized protein n=1 Tax=Granulicella rosea TaxID=474952 RepID=A0A239ECX8_9BACT|nr:hypothetical protein SAMN05421770_101897 [Granulicella rosea]